jgi:hypothetical protein
MILEVSIMGPPAYVGSAAAKWDAIQDSLLEVNDFAKFRLAEHTHLTYDVLVAEKDDGSERELAVCCDNINEALLRASVEFARAQLKVHKQIRFGLAAILKLHQKEVLPLLKNLPREVVETFASDAEKLIKALVGSVVKGRALQELSDDARAIVAAAATTGLKEGKLSELERIYEFVAADNIWRLSIGYTWPKVMVDKLSETLSSLQETYALIIEAVNEPFGESVTKAAKMLTRLVLTTVTGQESLETIDERGRSFTYATC